MGQSVLVTGGAGFIGSHVAERLFEAGFEVVALDDLSGGNRDSVPEGVHFEQGSIVDQHKVNALFEAYKFSYVFHLAAYAAEVLSHHIKRFIYTNNLIGSTNLINASVNHDVKCFVFTSSIGVYGNTPSPLTEDLTPAPKDSYGIAKYAVELELAACQEMFGLDYIIFRPHNVYGERQNIGDRYRNVIGIFMNQVMQNRPMSIFGDGSQTRAFSYISDVAPVIAESIHIPAASNQIFNVGAEKAYSVIRLATVVAEAMGVEPHIEHLPARFEASHPISNHEKIQRIMGHYEPVTLEQGVARMAAWAKRVGVRKSRPFEEIEIPKKLPPSWAAGHEADSQV
jgi:UDP-glucose 4-epimerase